MRRSDVAWLMLAALAGAHPVAAVSLAASDPAADLRWTGEPLPEPPVHERLQAADLLRLEAADGGGGMSVVVGVRPRAEGPEAPLAGSAVYRIHFTMDGKPHEVQIQRSRPLFSLADDASHVTAALYRVDGSGQPVWPGEPLAVAEDRATWQLRVSVPAALARGPVTGFWAQSEAFSEFVSFLLFPLGWHVLPGFTDRLPDAGTIPGVLLAPAPAPAGQPSPSTVTAVDEPAGPASGTPAPAEPGAGGAEAQGAPAVHAAAVALAAAAVAAWRRRRA